MKNNTINKKEIEKFSKIAEEWWNPEGKFKPLHKFNPIRISYIKNNYDVSEYDVIGASAGSWNTIPFLLDKNELNNDFLYDILKIHNGAVLWKICPCLFPCLISMFS